MKPFGFTVTSELGGDSLARTGVISTPHGEIKTPAFIVVGTKANVKAMVPEQIAAVGAQAVLANAYHLYLQPGHELIEKAGYLGKFMNWPGPTFTDSGGFQVLSLGSGFKKVLAMTTDVEAEIAIAKKGQRHAWVDDDGVTFKSHLDGSMHKFTPAAEYHNQAAFEAVLGFLPRIVLASLLAYLVGEFLNAYVLAKLKIRTKGKKMWLRLIGSTVIGGLADTIVFGFVAFGGILTGNDMLRFIAIGWAFKTGVEIVLLAVTYRVISFLKKHEKADAYDKKTDFSPTRLSI